MHDFDITLKMRNDAVKVLRILFSQILIAPNILDKGRSIVARAV